MVRYVCCLFLSALLYTGCVSGRKALREAGVMEEAGLSGKAFEKYEGLYYQNGNARALVGMKRVAQGVLDRKLSEAQMQCMRQDYETALAAYEEAFSYARRYPELELQVSSSADDQFRNCRRDFADHLYSEAEVAVLDDRFGEARTYLDRLKRLDPTHREADYLLTLCEIIPKYAAGKKAYELGLYRDAYANFLEVTRLDAGYKDAMSLRDLCKNQATITIAYLPLDNEKVEQSVESSFGAAIKEAILHLQDPFVQLVDRESTDQLIAEQMKGMSGLFDEKTAISAGQLTGARYILTGELIGYEPMTASQRAFERKAYLGASTESKKVRYTEYRLGRGLDVTFRFQLLDAQTGRVHSTGVLPLSERDNVVWADFEGDHSLLWPGEWKWQLIGSKEDVVYPDRRDELMEQFNGRKGPVSEQELRSRIMNAVAARVSRAVQDFRP